ncbi:hypothetical protein QFZ49_001381 [Streptomyces turgidiscabies]|uniref:Uncharacterized protein n=1 Tax=Streptomyces turgidiscabies TaxID=85558 RepID=A0ABU0RHL3_9ACTN|nr:hypothetical protein [Streptomyces turgidiscabies]
MRSPAVPERARAAGVVPGFPVGASALAASGRVEAATLSSETAFAIRSGVQKRASAPASLAESTVAPPDSRAV